MELVIDGYNVIRQSPVFKKAEQEGLEVGRETLIKYLEAYRKLKKHKITVVFDGENAAHLSIQKERIAGISVIYSPYGQTADEIIKRMVMKNSNLVVVTSDREIIDFVQRHRATSIPTTEFIPRLEMAFYSEIKGVEEDTPSSIAPIKKGPSRRLSKRQRKKQRVLKKM